MKTYYNAANVRQTSGGQPLLLTVVAMRLGVALLGFACILIGIVLAIKVFFLIIAALSGPATLPAAFDNWSRALGHIEARIDNSGQPREISRIVTVVILALGTLLLIHISTSIVATGSSMIRRAGEDLMKLRAELMGQTGGEAGSGERPYPATQAEPPTSFDKSTLD